MKREYINPAGVAPSPGDLYNHVVKVGNTVYIAGQVPRGIDGRALHAGDPIAQMRIVWSNLEKAVTAAGGSLKDIVKTTTYVVGAENVNKTRPVRLELLPSEGRPTSTTVVVAALADPDFLVEVEAIAVVD